MGFRFRPEWAPRRPGPAPDRPAHGARHRRPRRGADQHLRQQLLRLLRARGGVLADYAFRILYLPIGIFGVALGTMATAGLARRAAEGDMEGVRTTLRQSLSMLAFLTLPATAGLMVLGVPVVRLLYERGRFTPADRRARRRPLPLRPRPRAPTRG